AKDPKSMSVAEMLAAARGEKGGAAPAKAAAPTPEPAEEEPAAEAETSVAVESSESAPAANGKSQKGIITDIGEMVAYCRKVDG
ncbi:MAG: hypothetical protein KDA62_21190, partial [Planctomycetales bacterium]|nr:hypothetical protein [Planctomycetales bacterium]